LQRLQRLFLLYWPSKSLKMENEEEKDKAQEETGAPLADAGTNQPETETPPAPPESKKAAPPKTEFSEIAEPGFLGGGKVPPPVKDTGKAQSFEGFIGEEQAAKAAKMWVITLNSFLARGCAFVTGKDPSEYKPSPIESKEYETVTAEYFKSVNFAVSPAFSFALMTLSIYGLIFVKAYIDYKNANLAKQAAAAAVKAQAAAGKTGTDGKAPAMPGAFDAKKLFEDEALLRLELQNTPEFNNGRQNFMTAEGDEYYCYDMSRNYIKKEQQAERAHKVSRLYRYLLRAFEEQEKKDAISKNRKITEQSLARYKAKMAKDWTNAMRKKMGL